MRKTVVACTAISTIVWGLSFAVMKILLSYIDPMQVLSLRWTLAAVIFGAMYCMGKIKLNLHSPYLKFAIIAGLMEPCVYSILEIYGVDLMSASLAAIFIATIPTMTLIFGAILFRRKIVLLNAIGIILAFAGVCVATVLSPGFSVSGSLLGVICMVTAVISAAFYAFSVSKASEEYDAKAITFVMSVMGMIAFNIISLIMGYGAATYTVFFTNWHVLLGILFLGAGCSVFGYAAMNVLLSLIDEATANNLVGNLTTVVGVIGGILIAGDAWGIFTIIGMLLTICGVWLSSRTIN